MTKRMIALLLSLVMVLGLMAGCGSETASTPAASEAVQSEQSAPQEAPASEPAAAASTLEEGSVLEEETTAIAEYVRPAAVFPVAEETTTLSVWLPFTDIAGLIADVSQHLFFTELAEKTNVDLDILQISTWVANEQFNLMMAAQSYTDLISSAVTYYGSGEQAILDDVLIDLKPYLDDYAPNYKAIMNSDPDIYPMCTDDSGYISAFYQFKDKYIESNGFAIRQDWLDALGLDVPRTIAETETVLEAFHNNYDCAAPIFLGSNGVASSTGLICAFGVPGYTDDSPQSHLFQIDGKVTSSLLTEEYKDYITMLADWYQRGLIDALMNYGIEGESYVKNEDGTYSFTDAIVNAPEGWSQAVRMNAISDAFIGIYCTSSTQQMWSEVGYTARELWGTQGTPSDGAYNIPQAISLSADEMEEFSLLTSDISTMISENIVRFIDGSMSMDQWDGFVEQLRDMGLEDSCAIYQEALDRYYQRVA